MEHYKLKVAISQLLKLTLKLPLCAIITKGLLTASSTNFTDPTICKNCYSLKNTFTAPVKTTYNIYLYDCKFLLF